MLVSQIDNYINCESNTTKEYKKTINQDKKNLEIKQNKISQNNQKKNNIDKNIKEIENYLFVQDNS